MKFTLCQPLAIHELGQRTNQEDTIFPALGAATSTDRLFIVCDGMGGHEGGEVASQAVCEALSSSLAGYRTENLFFNEAVLTKALAQAYQALHEKNAGRQGRKMGTTLTLLLFHRGGVVAAYIGDSRIYHLRPSKHQLCYCTRDHSLVYDLFDAGVITRQEIKSHPQKNVITRAMMPDETTQAEPDVVFIRDVQPGDYFYLCTDGMLEQMDNVDILDIFANASLSDEEKRAKLLEATSDNADNHSAYILHVEAVEPEATDEAQPDNEAAMRLRNKILRDPSEDEVVMVDASNEEDAESPEQTAPAAPPTPSHAPAPLPSQQPQPESAPPAKPVQTQLSDDATTKNHRVAIVAAFIAVLALVIAIAVYFFVLRSDEGAVSSPQPRSVSLKQESEKPQRAADVAAPTVQPSAKSVPVAAKPAKQELKASAAQPVTPKAEVAEAPAAPAEQAAEAPAPPAPQPVAVNIPD